MWASLANRCQGKGAYSNTRVNSPFCSAAFPPARSVRIGNRTLSFGMWGDVVCHIALVLAPLLSKTPPFHPAAPTWRQWGEDTWRKCLSLSVHHWPMTRLAMKMVTAVVTLFLFPRKNWSLSTWNSYLYNWNNSPCSWGNSHGLQEKR